MVKLTVCLLDRKFSWGLGQLESTCGILDQSRTWRARCIRVLRSEQRRQWKRQRDACCEAQAGPALTSLNAVCPLFVLRRRNNKLRYSQATLTVHVMFSSHRRLKHAGSNCSHQLSSGSRNRWTDPTLIQSPFHGCLGNLVTGSLWIQAAMRPYDKFPRN